MDMFGYLVFPGLVSDRIDQITDSFEATFAHYGGHYGQAHDGTKRSCILPFIDQTDELASLLDDPRIDGIFTSLLGEDYNYIGSDGNFYVGDSGWHSDTDWHGQSRGQPPRLFYKMALYLDPVTASTGALRVIPGSHKKGDRFAEGVQAALMDRPGTLGLRGDQVPAVALESNPGDVVVFNQSLKHSSWGGGNRRRMFTINATYHYAEADQQLLRNEVGALARFWPDYVYGEAMMRTAGPQRLVHMQQAISQADYLAQEVVKAKATMKEPARG
jgi:hypothetical protein